LAAGTLWEFFRGQEKAQTAAGLDLAVGTLWESIPMRGQEWMMLSADLPKSGGQPSP
jgi:hypothetical protein